MTFTAKQWGCCVTGAILKRVVLSAAFTFLLVPALRGSPSEAAESTYHLVGTVQSKDFIGAVIITSDGTQSFYRLRETLPDGAQLVQVHSDSIAVKGPDGSRYEMYITAAGKQQTTAGPGASAFTPPQAQTPADNDRQSRPARKRSYRSSSGEE
jgi:hypothetical protein